MFRKQLQESPGCADIKPDIIKYLLYTDIQISIRDFCDDALYKSTFTITITIYIHLLFTEELVAK